MNKITKGVIAGAAGVLLLSGGAGTFAAWNSSSNLASGSVQTGTLAFDATQTAGTWYDVTNTTAVAIGADLTGYKIVPGSTIEFRQTVKIDATGNNLVANFGYTNPTITKASAADANFTATVAINGSLPTGVTANATSGYDIDASQLSGGTVSVPLKLDITFKGTTSGTTDQASTIDFSQTALTLQQTAPAHN